MGYLIGIDVGTSGVKALLVSAAGAVRSSATIAYGMDTPRPGWAEQKPETWGQASVQAIRQLLKQGKIKGAEVSGLGLTGQMHSSVFLDRSNRVIRPALLWCDQRTQAECDEITATVGFQRLVKLTANRALTGFTAPKILWLRNHEPKNFKKLKRLLLSKDYLRFLLTGEFATEVSDASGTLLFDVVNRRWSDPLLKLLDLDPAILPRCFESFEITGGVTEAAARETGLKPGTPVVGGGGDQAAGAIGNGMVKSGPILITIGTSGVVFSASDRPLADPQARLHSFCHASPGLWHTMGVMLAAGGSLQWFRNTLAELGTRPSYDRLTAQAAAVPAGSEGLFFLPYLSGERTPHFDANARGVFAGLSFKHGLGHLTRAVLEGVAFGLKDSVEIMKEVGSQVREVYLSGGGARSELWTQIVADVLELPIKRLAVDEGPSFGAALLAAVGVGLFPDTAAAAAATLKLKDEILPRRQASARYRELYPRWRSLYQSLKPEFQKSAGEEK